MRVGDLYWQAPTDVYDVSCDFFSHFSRQPINFFFNMNSDLHYGPEHVFAYYLKECNLKLEQIYPNKVSKTKAEHMTGGGDYETVQYCNLF